MPSKKSETACGGVIKSPSYNPFRMSTDCPICAAPYTAQVRKPVACGYCDFAACNVCCKKYLTEGTLDAHCMNCRRAWNDEFIDMNFTRAFRTGPYKTHRESVLLEREMSLLPTRQPRVEAAVKCNEVHEQLRGVHKQLLELESLRSKILRDSSYLNIRLARFTAEKEGRAPPAWTLTEGERGTGAPPTERAKFIMKCPASECRGFLSTAYKCGTCQMWACPDCLVVKGAEKDAEHACDPGQKESVALIIKESKSCPKCGERIGKIDGCDQMWCTECHTAFSWATGQEVNGVIHNPHYYEFLRKMGNGTAPRNAGDVPCGGVPYYTNIQRAIGRIGHITQREVMIIHRLTAEITDQRIQMYQGYFNVEDNGDLGVKYLMHEMDKPAMKTELARRELKRNKHLAIRAVLEMFVNTSTMMLNAIVNDPPASEEAFQATLTEFRNLRNYVNESLFGVSRMKSCSVPQISDTWQWKQFCKAPPKEKPARAPSPEITPEEAAKKKKRQEAAKKAAETRKKKAGDAATAGDASDDGVEELPDDDELLDAGPGDHP